MASNRLRREAASAHRGESDVRAARASATLSTREAAAALGVSEQAVRQAIARGALAAARRGRAWCIRQDELARYAQRRQGPGSTQSQGRIVALPVPATAPTVPVPGSRFVGREAELAALVALLADPGERVVTLTGPGGIGKTRLALAAAAAAVARFPDGVFFVDLAAIAQARSVLPAMAQAVGLREQGGRDRMVQLAAILRGKRALLILDNCEHVLEAAPDVARLLAAAPETTVLATSRAPLRIGGERVLPTPPLTLAAGDADPAALMASDAGRLFVERARGHDPAFVLDRESAPLIADICARLDGLPLAIELAAARVRLLPPRLLRDRLEPRLLLLTHGARDAPVRLSTMRDAIAWSYDLLSAEEQRLFRWLAVFAGGATLEAAEWVVGVGSAVLEDETAPVDPAVLPPPPNTQDPPSTTLDRLGALVDHSLLSRDLGPDGQPRLRMLETIREFGLERLAADAAEEAALRAAHARYFLRFAQSLRPVVLRLATRETFDRLAADAANLRAATIWLADRGDPADLAGMVAACYLFWYAAGHVRETETWLERALARNDQVPAIERARLLNGRAELLMVRGESDKANALFAEALALLRDAGATVDRALALIAYGASLNFAGSYAAGETVLGEGLALTEAIVDRSERIAAAGDALSNLSDSARGLGNLDLAAARGEEALRRYESQRLEQSELRVLTTLGSIARDQGRYRLAVERYLTCLARNGEDGEVRLIATDLEGIASAAAAWGQSRTALLLFGAAGALRERAGIPMSLPVDAARVERDVATLRETLGAAAADALLCEGRGLPLTEAMRIAATLHGLTAAEASPRRGPGPALTRRERQVLDLLAKGLTDREIAERLFLSPRTVNWHVRAILAKLGATSRGDAVSQARVRGLL
jgi:non-specific serine/threonine protein kinase